MQNVVVASGIFSTASSPTSLTFPFTPGTVPPGTYRLQVRVDGVGNNWSQSSDQSFTLTAAPISTITSFTPTTVVAGTPANIVVTGTNFSTNNVLRFMNMQNVPVWAIQASTSSSTSLTFALRSDSNVPPGTYRLQSRFDGLGNNWGPSSDQSITLTAANANAPIPTITSFTPTTAVAGTTQGLVITGTNFSTETVNVLRFVNTQDVQVGNVTWANTSSPTSVTFGFPFANRPPGTYRLQVAVGGVANFIWSPSSDQSITLTAWNGQ